MELTQLRYFYAVAQNLHVTKTAEQLHIAQPALTQSIHRLENELGYPLFSAQGRNIVLTAYGKYLKEQLAPMLETLDRIPHELEKLASFEQKNIHINVNAASAVITECIIQYRKIHTSTHFQVFQNDSVRMPYDIDIGTELQHKGKSSNTYIFTEKIMLAVPAAGKYEDRQGVSLSEVSDEEFISLAGVKSFRTICDKYCRESGFSPKIAFESDNQSAVKNLIAANVGIGFWPQYTWGTIESSDVKLIAIEDVDCKRDIIIRYNENKEDVAEVKSFFDFLVSQMELLTKNKKSPLRMFDNP